MHPRARGQCCHTILSSVFIDWPIVVPDVVPSVHSGHDSDQVLHLVQLWASLAVSHLPGSPCMASNLVSNKTHL